MSTAQRAGAIFFLLASCCSAHASVFTVEYAGLISSGTDANNDFVGVDADLSGSSVVVRYQYDTTLSAVKTYAQGSVLSGGTLFGNVSPLLSATITIGGRSLVLDGKAGGVLRGESTSASTYRYHEADAADGSVLASSVTAAAKALPNDLFAPFSYNIGDADRVSGSFTLADGTTADFTPTALVSTVPLPEGLPLFATGLLALGAAGVLGRRMRATAANA